MYNHRHTHPHAPTQPVGDTQTQKQNGHGLVLKNLKEEEGGAGTACEAELAQGAA